MEMQVAYIRIFVSDLDRALDFYGHTLGLAISHRDNDFGWAQLVTKGATLALEQLPADADDFKQLIGRYLGVTVTIREDLRAWHERLSAAGVEFSGVPEEMPWGGLMTQISDPDGNVLTVLEAPFSQESQGPQGSPD